MARKYDIAQRIANANQKPTITIDKDHEYKINTGKSAALMLQAIAEENNGSLEFLNKVTILALGNEAAEYIESLELTLPAYNLIVEAILVAYQDKDLDEVETEKK